MFLFSAMSTTFAQVDITSIIQDFIDDGTINNSYLFSGDSLLSPGDSMTIDVVLGQVTLTSDDSDVDTVRSNLFFRGSVVSGTTEVTVSSENGDTMTFDVSNTSQDNVFTTGTLDFIENSTTTVTIKNTSTTNDVTINRLTLQANSSRTSVISNTDYGLLQKGDVYVSNPITNGMLQIKHLPSSFVSTSLELITLEGMPILSKVITQNDASIDVSRCESGIYLLRETETGYVKKIVIQ